MNTDALSTLARSLTTGGGPFAFCGMAVSKRGQKPVIVSCAAPGIAAGRGAFFRAASVSKIVTGQTVMALAGQGALGADISDQLGWRLRHPAFDDVPLTLAMVLSHAAGLSDAGGYVSGTPLRDQITRASWGSARPGTASDYANIGYVVLAAVAERLGGDSFDVLARRHVLDPLGIRAGFNWSGLDAAERAMAIPTWRWDGAAFRAMIDADVPPTGVIGPAGPVDMATYVPAANPALFSPQGGLRISLDGMARLALALGDMDCTALWTPDMGPGDYASGVMAGYGAGIQVFDAPAFYPRPLVGHFGNAYGFYGGCWFDRTAQTGFAYALNGLDMDDGGDAFKEQELAIFAAIADQIA